MCDPEAELEVHFAVGYGLANIVVCVVFGSKCKIRF
jgi:hypothetical protein